VPRTGIEPVRTVKSCGFSYPPRLWPPHTATRRMFGVWSAPSPWWAADAARVRCPPSALYTFRLNRGSLARRCLAVDAAGGSPTLTGSIPHVSARALKLLSSPLRLPISPSRPVRMVARADDLPRASATREVWFDLILRATWRRGPESNWAGRICNPLHNRFATAPTSLPDQPATNSRKREAGDSLGILERETRLELATSTLARLRSTN